MGQTLDTQSKANAVASMKSKKSKNNLDDILSEVRKLQTKEKVILQVDRDCVFRVGINFFNTTACEERPLEVRFNVDNCTEETVNLGGPNKEFFSLFFQAVLDKKNDMFESAGPYVIPVGNRADLEKEFFTALGRAIVISLCCGGTTFARLAPYAINYIRGYCFEHLLELSLIGNTTLRDYIQKIVEATTQEEIDGIIGRDEERFLDYCGWKRSEMIKVTNKDQYIQVLLYWELVAKRKDALDQLKKGLSILNFLEKVKDFEDLENVLSMDTRQQTANHVREHVLVAVRRLQCRAADEERAKEYTTACIQDFTDDECCEFYQFITGMAAVPYSPYAIDVDFNRANRTAKLPESSTCVLKLLIPLGNETKIKFYSSFNTAITHGRVGFSETSGAESLTHPKSPF